MLKAGPQVIIRDVDRDPHPKATRAFYGKGNRAYSQAHEHFFRGAGADTMPLILRGTVEQLQRHAGETA